MEVIDYTTALSVISVQLSQIYLVLRLIFFIVCLRYVRGAFKGLLNIVRGRK